MSISNSKLSRVISICSALALASCEGKPKIHYAEQLEYDVGGYYVDYPSDSTWIGRSKREVFIIENAPKNRGRLIEIVKENETSIPIDKHHIEATYDEFYRDYFRESWRTPVDFVETKSKFGSSDELHEHEDDLICTISMNKWPSAPDSLMYHWKCSCPELEDMFISK